MAYRLVHGLFFATSAAIQPPHHDKGAHGQSNDVEQQHGRAQKVGKSQMPPFKANLCEVDAEAQSVRVTTEAATREQRKRLGAESRPDEVQKGDNRGVYLLAQHEWLFGGWVLLNFC